MNALKVKNTSMQLDTHTRKRLKMLAASREETMKKSLIHLIDEYLKKEEEETV